MARLWARRVRLAMTLRAPHFLPEPQWRAEPAFRVREAVRQAAWHRLLFDRWFLFRRGLLLDRRLFRASLLRGSGIFLRGNLLRSDGLLCGNDLLHRLTRSASRLLLDQRLFLGCFLLGRRLRLDGLLGLREWRAFSSFPQRASRPPSWPLFSSPSQSSCGGSTRVEQNRPRYPSIARNTRQSAACDRAGADNRAAAV